MPDHAEERSTWCAALKSDLESDNNVEVLVLDMKTVLQSLDERKSPEEVASILGDSPETTVVVGRTEGADCALYMLEQRPLGGAVLYDLKNRRTLLWSAIKKHAGPRGGNLALVVGDPPHGSRFPERYTAKLGVETWLHSSKLAWATRACIRGVARPAPRRVRLFALTAGLSADAFQTWKDKLPDHVDLYPVRCDILLTTGRPPADGLVGIGRKLADELLAERPCPLDLPSMVFGHDLGAWIAYEVLLALEQRRQARDHRRATTPPAAAPTGGLHARNGGDFSRRGANGAVASCATASGTKKEAEAAAESSWQLPSVLLVSSMRAPHLHDPATHEADRRTPFISSITSSAGFYAAFKRRYGLHPTIEEDADMREHFEPMLRQQSRLIEQYSPACGEKPRPITSGALRVIACGAAQDGRVLYEHLPSWEGYAGATPLETAAVAGLSGRYAGDDDAASFASLEFDIYAARIKTIEAKKEEGRRKKTMRQDVYGKNLNILPLTYKPTVDDRGEFLTGELHRYVLETPEPLIELLCAEAALLGVR